MLLSIESDVDEHENIYGMIFICAQYFESNAYFVTSAHS